MENLSPCPKCNSEYTYEMDNLMVCPDCGYEWDPNEVPEVEFGLVVKDANGTILANGDSVVIAKDLPVKVLQNQSKPALKSKISDSSKATIILIAKSKVLVRWH